MRIVITGMGVVSPFGTGVVPFWESLCAGRSGISELTCFNTDGFAFTRGGEVPDFELAPTRTAGAPVDLATAFMLSAAQEAMTDAGLPGMDRERTGVVFATNFGGAASLEPLLAGLAGTDCVRTCPPKEYMFQRAADHAAATWGLSGPRSVLSLSCSSGTAALGYGAGLIRAGHATAVLTGGYDALSPFCWAGLSALRTMTRDEVRPFDLNRTGTLFSEGAGALVLETYEQAVARGAVIHAELLGYGFNNNAYHMTAPSPEGAGSARVMQTALDDAGLTPEAIDHINTHGTGTRHNDVTETQAIKAVLGTHAAACPITSIKSMTGHLMGAAGSAEAIASILTLRDGVIPPTINYAEPDPECDLDLVSNAARSATIDTVLSNSAGIGGCNAAVVIGKGPSA